MVKTMKTTYMCKVRTEYTNKQTDEQIELQSLCLIERKIFTNNFICLSITASE